MVQRSVTVKKPSLLDNLEIEVTYLNALIEMQLCKH